MNSSIIRYILGHVMRMEACFLLLPCIVSLVYGESEGDLLSWNSYCVPCFWHGNGLEKA